MKIYTTIPEFLKFLESHGINFVDSIQDGMVSLNSEKWNEFNSPKVKYNLYFYYKSKTSPGYKYISAIKEIRQYTGLDLKGAKDVIDGVGYTVRYLVKTFENHDQAKEAVNAFLACGALVELEKEIVRF